MMTLTIDDIQHDFMACLRRVGSGETLVVVDADHPVAEIRPIAITQKARRPFGLAAGEFTVPDDFDAPLPDDLLDAFEGR